MNLIVTLSIVKNIGVGKAPCHIEGAMDYNSHISQGDQENSRI